MIKLLENIKNGFSLEEIFEGHDQQDIIAAIIKEGREALLHLPQTFYRANLRYFESDKNLQIECTKIFNNAVRKIYTILTNYEFNPADYGCKSVSELYYKKFVKPDNYKLLQLAIKNGDLEIIEQMFAVFPNLEEKNKALCEYEEYVEHFESKKEFYLVKSALEGCGGINVLRRIIKMMPLKERRDVFESPEIFKQYVLSQNIEDFDELFIAIGYAEIIRLIVKSDKGNEIIKELAAQDNTKVLIIIIDKFINFLNYSSKDLVYRAQYLHEFVKYSMVDEELFNRVLDWASVSEKRREELDQESYEELRREVQGEKEQALYYALQNVNSVKLFRKLTKKLSEYNRQDLINDALPYVILRSLELFDEVLKYNPEVNMEGVFLWGVDHLNFQFLKKLQAVRPAHKFQEDAIDSQRLTLSREESENIEKARKHLKDYMRDFSALYDDELYKKPKAEKKQSYMEKLLRGFAIFFEEVKLNLPDPSDISYIFNSSERRFLPEKMSRFDVKTDPLTIKMREIYALLLQGLDKVAIENLYYPDGAVKISGRKLTRNEVELEAVNVVCDIMNNLDKFRDIINMQEALASINLSSPAYSQEERQKLENLLNPDIAQKISEQIYSYRSNLYKIEEVAESAQEELEFEAKSMLANQVNAAVKTVLRQSGLTDLLYLYDRKMQKELLPKAEEKAADADFKLGAEKMSTIWPKYEQPAKAVDAISVNALALQKDKQNLLWPR